LLAQVLADDDTGGWLRRNARFTVIPFVDKDGVEDGDQGKNRRPRDHNRDYDGESVHPSVAAIRTMTRAWPAGELRVHLDLHCPGLSDRQIAFIGGKDQAIWDEVQKLSKILASVQSGPLKFDPGDNMPFGKGWNTSSSYTAGMSSTGWTSALPGVALAATIEFPYATAGGAAVTAESARAFGRDLGTALRRYLAQGPQ
jgi:hypothetical protein